MSIIYDALQKTQRQLNTKNQLKTIRPFHNWFDVILVSIILILLIVTLIAYFPIFKKWMITDKKHPVIPTHTVTPRPSPGVKLILNGIFISENDKVAQINNRLVSVGDAVEGNRVLEITSNKVKLVGKNGIFYLYSESFP